MTGLKRCIGTEQQSLLNTDSRASLTCMSAQAHACARNLLHTAENERWLNSMTLSGPESVHVHMFQALKIGCSVQLTNAA